MCDRCNSSRHSCSCNSAPLCGGCAIILPTNCVRYDYNYLEHLGIKQGDSLQDILGKIDTKYEELFNLITDGFIGVNIGGGKEIFKQVDLDDPAEFRTFVNTPTIVWTQDASTLKADIDPLFLENYLEGITEDDVTLKQNFPLYNLVPNTNKQDDLNYALYNDIQNVKGAITVLDSKTALKQSDEYVTSFPMLTLTKTPAYVESINVYYEGLLIPKTAWQYNATNKTVAVDLVSLGVSPEADDNYAVVYEYK